MDHVFVLFDLQWDEGRLGPSKDRAELLIPRDVK